MRRETTAAARRRFAAASRSTLEGRPQGELSAAGSSEVLRDRIAKFGIVLATAAFVGLVVAHVTNAVLLDRSLWQLDADNEGNVLTWAAVAATSAAAFVALLHAVTLGRDWRLYGILAVVFAFFSLDDLVQVHDLIAQWLTTLGERIGVEYLGHIMWPIVFLPLLVVSAVGLWRVARESDAHVSRLLRVGIATLVAAIAVEISGGLMLEAEDSEATWAYYTFEVALEEGLELAGWVLVAFGLAAGLPVRFASGGREAANPSLASARRLSDAPPRVRP